MDTGIKQARAVASKTTAIDKQNRMLAFAMYAGDVIYFGSFMVSMLVFVS